MIQEALFDAPTKPVHVKDAQLPPEPPKLTVVTEHSEIPPEHTVLYQAYLAKVRSHKLPRLMWVVLDYDHFIAQFTRNEHVWWMGTMLRSGHAQSVKVAVEAMGRTLGEWSSR